MANIDLGTFTFDAGKVEEQLKSVQAKMLGVRIEAKAYSDNVRTLDKAISGLIKEQSSLVQSQKELEKQGKKNTKEYRENQEAIDKSNKGLELLIKKNLESSEALNKAKEKQKEVNKEYKESVAMKKLVSDADGNLVTSTESINIALENEIKSIADARASNKELLALRNQLDIAGGNNAEELANLNAALDRNNAFIKENVSAYEQQKIGIGDYQNAIENALGGTKLFGVGLNDVKNSLNQFAPVLNLIKGELSSIKDSFKTATNATQGYSTAQKAAAVTTAATSGALKLFRIALIATGIGAIVVVLGSLIAYLSTTQKGIDAVTSVTRPLAAVFQTLVGVLQDVGEYLFNAFANPKKTIEDVYNFVKDKVVKVFSGLATVLEGIATLKWDKIKQGVEEINQVAIDALESIKEVGTELGNKFDDAINKGREYDQLQKQLEQREIDMIAYRAQANIELKKAELIQQNQLLSAEERNKAIAEGERISKELVARETELLDLGIKILENKQSRNDTSREEEKELQGLIAQRIESENKVLDVEKKSLGARKQLYNEAANAAKARIKEVQEAAIKASDEDLKLFLASQGFKRKSAEEELKIAEEKKDKELAILEQELEFKRISQKEYQTQLLQINDEYLQVQRDLVIENAERERDALLETLSERQNDYKDYTEERLEFEREAIDARLEVEQEFADLQLEKGVINQQEYDDIISEIKKEAREAELDAQLDFDEANKERLLVDAENERILEEQAYTDKFELQKFRLEQKRLAEIEAAEQTGADITLINEKYSEQRKKIDELEQENKIDLASNAFAQLASIFGKESKLGKAAAIAQTTIDTYQSAVSSYKSLSGIPIVGPALGALAAGAAVATGLGNVKKIVGTNVPTPPTRAERGMKIPKWGTMLRGRSHKQGGIPIEAEGGEAIINKRSTEMFGNLLSEINMAGGGIPLAARGAIVGNTSSKSVNIQSRLLKDANDSAMAQMMADSVGQSVEIAAERGTARGSQTGLIRLSENRQVQNNSAF